MHLLQYNLASVLTGFLIKPDCNTNKIFKYFSHFKPNLTLRFIINGGEGVKISGGLQGF